MAESRLSPLVAEFFRHGSNLGMGLGLAGLAGYLATQPAAWRLLPWVALGIAMFPFYEYVFHRFILHTRPAKHPALAWFQHLIHYEHHEETQRVDRFFTPLWVGFPLVCTQAALYLLLGLSAPTALALLFGNLAGFLYYEWTHYVAHIAYQPKTRFGQYMKKYHLWHHHKNENYFFGVTTPVVDYLMGTYKPIQEVPVSPTVRRLHGHLHPDEI